MDGILWVINFDAIVICVIALAFAVKNYVNNQKVKELHAAVASTMSLCGHYVRGTDFYLRKNGGDDHFDDNMPVKYVNHMSEFKVFIKE